MEKFEVNRLIEKLTKQVSDLNNKIAPSELKVRLDELNNIMQSPTFWNDSDSATKVTKEANLLSEKIEKIEKLEKDLESVKDWLEISEERTEEWEILEEDLSNLEKVIDDFSIEILLSDEYDTNNAILEIHAGAGGTEAMDWALMIFRMYQRYANNMKYKMEILDYQQGEEAGIKSVTMLVKGDYAYGYLKAERGVHRLVRISPFDSNARRHTSFVSVEVMPEIDNSVSVEIKDEDLRVDVYRSSGAGGQSVNTTDSAVRITHIPTNIIVSCQNERSQIKNRETAMNLLKAKLIQEEIRKKEEKLANIKGELKDIAWGSQIRSYVFHPYQMVKDHRTNYETSQINDVMDGDLQDFISAYLKARG
ncbi:peptide chain release factor 2 [Haploplasma modicum]|jgi:peptide chain release factor 2|uniref:peptide chain release factor 2 n=1 Tax=Haploplasma modicum TaxID=2150 RepID=UPI00214AC069|nr:peptide chain release factor 2 [Haploplasma modicum]MCR1808954.1 peptide chain release factor 2 [Haploplasma modicum]